MKFLSTTAGRALLFVFFFCSSNATETVSIKNQSRFSAYVAINDKIYVKLKPQFLAKISHSKELLKNFDECETHYVMQFILVNENDQVVYASCRYNIKKLLGTFITLASSPFTIAFGESSQEIKEDSEEIDPIIFSGLPFFLGVLQKERGTLRLW